MSLVWRRVSSPCGRYDGGAGFVQDAREPSPEGPRTLRLRGRLVHLDAKFETYGADGELQPGLRTGGS